MQDAKTKSLPCDVGFNKFDCQESKPLENPTLFRAIIGSLVYIMTCTRPDISYVVTRLSQYMDKPNKAHLALAKDVLRYLKGTISSRLTVLRIHPRARQRASPPGKHGESLRIFWSRDLSREQTWSSREPERPVGNGRRIAASQFLSTGEVWCLTRSSTDRIWPPT